MHFYQSNIYVECFLVPFSEFVGKNLSKNDFGLCLTFFEQVKWKLKNYFLAFFARLFKKFPHQVLLKIHIQIPLQVTPCLIYTFNMAHLKKIEKLL